VKPKVFCIGFHKTGTSSLGAALRILGYRVTGPNGVHDPNIANNVDAMTDSLVGRFDAFQDNPWPVLYQKLDAKYPDSKFVLTTRDSASWIKSQIKDFGRVETPMRQWIYGAGCPLGNEAIYVRRYETHNANVLEHFRNRPGDLLVMDLTKGDGWPALCAFLGVAVPDVPFPHTNKSGQKPLTWRKRLLQKARRMRKQYFASNP
jgi:Sulfotransferase domain